MMSRDKLRQVKALLRRNEAPADPNQLLHSLVDSHLEVLDQLEGGKSTQEQRAELKERDRQVKLAITDLRVMLSEIQLNVPADLVPAVVDGEPLVRDLSMAVYTIDLIEQMLRAKGPDWTREWQWYFERVKEEFGDEAVGAHR